MGLNASNLAATKVQRISDTEVEATRLFDAPPHLVFKAWTTPELFQRWWAPKSMGVPMHVRELDVRVGGSYRIEFEAEGGQIWAFFGKYTDVVPNQRIVWTNEESGDSGAISSVTLKEQDGKTLLTFRETYPTKEALDEGIGGTEGLPEQFGQLEELLGEMAA
ncbi:SRPBCC domain-containing protein [Sphingomonas sp. HITSZ_GF]|uniref:SRPBCC domain-containing protein n=1 Tax=Sphingomonas sp. HITSZ_GF TaxID=3037247 RepID=UPI00240DDB70|nr:SRPBCC domain-containing protein [Sphingomonas sp. HITSZ_GF]MDG2534721.1 SRPBCC domain-containing protein [Sphingomonas sp. HITSZ_GF]